MAFQACGTNEDVTPDRPSEEQAQQSEQVAGTSVFYGAVTDCLKSITETGETFKVTLSCSEVEVATDTTLLLTTLSSWANDHGCSNAVLFDTTYPNVLGSHCTYHLNPTLKVDSGKSGILSVLKDMRHCGAFEVSRSDLLLSLTLGGYLSCRY